MSIYIYIYVFFKSSLNLLFRQLHPTAVLVTLGGFEPVSSAFQRQISLITGACYYTPQDKGM